MKKSLLHWTARDPGTGADFRAIASDGTRFAAVGDAVAVSDDGATWKVGPPTGARLSSIAWGAGVYVATGCLPAAHEFAIFTSSDGGSWVRRPSPMGITGVADHLYPVCFGDGRFVIGGGIIALGNFVLHYFESADGMAWVDQESDQWPNMEGPVLVARDGKMLAFATYGMLDVPTGPPVNGTYGSSNQLTPTALAIGQGQILLGGWFTAPSDTGIWTTTNNGMNWKRRATTPSAVRQIAWLGDTFVAVGDNGLILLSDDGAAWSTVSAGTRVNLSGVATNGDRAVIVGERGTVLQSDRLDAKYLKVRFSGKGRGIVFSTPAGLLAEKEAEVGFAPGTVVCLSARPEPKTGPRDRAWSEFAGWSGAARGVKADCLVTMSAHRLVTAKFSRRTR